MIAEIDVGTATLLAAVLVLIGTFAINTGTTIRQERARRRAQQAKKGLFKEISIILSNDRMSRPNSSLHSTIK